MKRLRRGFQLSLGSIFWYTFLSEPLRKLGDLKHFPDTNFLGASVGGEIERLNYIRFSVDIHSSSMLP